MALRERRADGEQDGEDQRVGGLAQGEAGELGDPAAEEVVAAAGDRRGDQRERARRPATAAAGPARGSRRPRARRAGMKAPSSPTKTTIASSRRWYWPPCSIASVAGLSATPSRRRPGGAPSGSREASPSLSASYSASRSSVPGRSAGSGARSWRVVDESLPRRDLSPARRRGPRHRRGRRKRAHRDRDGVGVLVARAGADAVLGAAELQQAQGRKTSS